MARTDLGQRRGDGARPKPAELGHRTVEPDLGEFDGPVERGGRGAGAHGGASKDGGSGAPRRIQSSIWERRFAKDAAPSPEPSPTKFSGLGSRRSAIEENAARSLSS